MNRQRLLHLMPLVAALAGCATLDDPDSYVGGHFTLRRPDLVTAFVLTNQQTGEEFLLPFTHEKQFRAGHNETALVRVPPGTYRLTHWIVFEARRGPGAAGKDFRAEMQPGPATAPFTLRRNELLYLGRFVADNQAVNGYISSTTSGSWTIEHIPPERSKPDAKPGS